MWKPCKLLTNTLQTNLNAFIDFQLSGIKTGSIFKGLIFCSIASDYYKWKKISQSRGTVGPGRKLHYFSPWMESWHHQQGGAFLDLSTSQLWSPLFSPLHRGQASVKYDEIFLHSWLCVLKLSLQISFPCSETDFLVHQVHFVGLCNSTGLQISLAFD